MLPPEEHRKLPALEVVPKPVNNQPEMKLPRRRFDSQGPETIHNRLIYRQHGLMALSGGELSPSHIRMIRETVNRHVKENMFAVWRIDPPWKNVTRKVKFVERKKKELNLQLSVRAQAKNWVEEKVQLCPILVP